MNIKDYTLKIGYRIGGKCKEESVEYALVKNGGYDGEDIRICDFGDADHVKIVVSAKKQNRTDACRTYIRPLFREQREIFCKRFPILDVYERV